MLSDREIRIIKYLFNNREKYCTSKEIGYNVGFSEKTIRDSINNISTKIPKDVFEISSKRGKGFKIHIYSDDKYMDYLYESKRNINNIDHIYDKEGREKFILENLLLENKKITFDNLISRLFISESTLQRDIYDLREKLVDYELDIIKDKNGVLTIKGKELNKRHFILDFFFSERYSNSFINELGDLNLFDRHTISQLLIILLDEIREYKISVNDYIIQNLVIHFALVIERVRKNCIVDKNVDISKRVDEKIYKFSQAVIDRISKSFHISLPQEEKNYIYLQLLAKTKVDHVESSKSLLSNRKITNLIKYLSKNLGINLLEDTVFINGFTEHLYSLNKRVESGLFVSNPLTDQIKSLYKSYFDLVREAFEKYEIFLNTDVPDDEWSYIVIYILSALERNKQNTKLNVLIVCASGFSTGLMLKSRIQNEYNNTINIKEVVGYYEIGSRNLDNVDFIISTIDLDGLVIPIPYVKVSVFLDDTDCSLIDKLINEIKASDNMLDLNDSSTKEESHKEKLFNKYFSTTNFYIDDKEANKDQVLDRIFKSLATNPSLEKKFREETLLRDRFGKVVFKNQIAIPHPVHPLKAKGEVFSYISRKNIYWNDEDKVSLVFFISPPSLADTDFEKMIAVFTKLLKDKEAIENLKSVENFEEFKEIILSLM